MNQSKASDNESEKIKRLFGLRGKGKSGWQIEQEKNLLYGLLKTD